jgi:PAS domain S-box-containing protein
MDKELRILILEDVPTDAELEEHELRKAGLVFISKVVDTREAFLKELDEFSPDIILSDYELPSFDGLAALRIAQEKCPDVPFILVTGKVGEEFAIETLKKGVTDYVMKGNLKRLVPAINRALEEAEMTAKRKQAEKALHESEELYHSLFRNMLNGFAYCRMLFEEGNPHDFIYLAVNDAFESQTGLKDVVGRKVTEVIPNIRETDWQLFEIYGRVAITGQPEHFEIFIVTLQEWFSVSVYSPAHEYFVSVFDVITERKKAEEQKDRILNMSSDLICVAGTDGYFKYVNPEWERTLGYSTAEFLSKPFLDFIHPDDHRKNDEEVVKLAAGKKTIDFENRYIHKDGSIRIISWKATPLPEKGLMYCTGRDITERKLSQEQVKRLNESIGLAMEASNSGTWDWDILNNTFEWSPQFLKIFGMPPETIAGFEAWKNSLHPEDREVAAKKIQDSINDKTELTNDYRIILPNQEIRWIRAIGKTFYDENKPIRMTGLCIDITADKQLEMKLRESEEKYRLVVENAHDAILILQDGKIKFHNHQSIALSGYSEKEIKDVPFSSFIHADDKDMVIEMHRKRLLGESIPSTYSFRFIKKTGETIWIQVSGILITWEGRPAALVFLSDITDRKEMEKALKEKMDSLEYWNNMFIDREQKMMDLKKEINTLLVQLGQPTKYMW